MKQFNYDYRSLCEGESVKYQLTVFFDDGLVVEHLFDTLEDSEKFILGFSDDCGYCLDSVVVKDIA